MATHIKAVLDAMTREHTISIVNRSMKVDLMGVINSIADPWVQAQVQRRHHIRMTHSPLTSAFGRPCAESTIKHLKIKPTPFQRVALARYDRKMKLREKVYEYKMARVS